jgi:hypothetical protein
MSSGSSILPADPLRRTRSTGDLPTAEFPRPGRAQSVHHRRSESHHMPPLVILSELESPIADPLLFSPRHTWSPVITRVLEEEHIGIDAQMDTVPRRRLGFYGSILAFFGLGQAQEARKELVSIIFNLVWNSIQVCSVSFEL